MTTIAGIRRLIILLALIVALLTVHASGALTQETTQGMVVEKRDAHVPMPEGGGVQTTTVGIRDPEGNDPETLSRWEAGQSFTARNSGEVTRAKMLLDYGPYPPYDLVMQIRTVNQSDPYYRPGTVLATSETIPGATWSQEPGAKIVTGNFGSSPANVVAGEEYYLTVRPDANYVWGETRTSWVSPYGYDYLSTEPDVYPDGHAWAGTMWNYITGSYGLLGPMLREDQWFEIYVRGLDNQAPPVEIGDIARAGEDNDYTATFSSPDEYVDFFEIKLDEGEWLRATSPLALNDLSYGNHTLYVRATDTANNMNQPVSQVFTVEHPDTVAPLSTARATTASGPYEQPGTWTNKDVKVEFAATDNESGSGVKEIVYALNGGTPVHVVGASADVTVSQEGINEIAYYAEDQAGRVEATKILTVKLDKTAPVIEQGIVSGGWSKTDVSVPFTASDKAPAGVTEVSGLADPAEANFTLSTNVGADTETADAHTGTRQVADNAGNVVTAGPVGDLKVDKKAPTITIVTPAEGAQYVLKQAVAADYSAIDGGSGLADGSPSSPVENGANIDTTTVGAKSFTVTAADKVGNQAALSNNYQVVFDFGDGGNGSGGFVNQASPPTLNTVGGGKAGAAIQVRFSLGGYYGLEGIFAAGYPTSKSFSCPNSAGTNPADDTIVAESSSGLKYDDATDEYIYVWKTDRAWNNSCRQLTMKLQDGTEHPLYFQFLK